MKYFFIISLFAMIPFMGVKAQENTSCNKGSKYHELMVKYMEQKKEYLKQCIPLTDKDVDAFFKLYDELEKKKHDVIFPVYKEVRKIKKSTEQINDELYLEVTDKLSDISSKIAEIEKEYYEKLKLILTPKQLFQFFDCEHNYGKRMLKKEQTNK